MSIGFIHGVMNTDNMSISGETIDYGPCAFMDYFNFQQVYSFIDRDGRYSFINQPKILSWNLARLADTLIAIVKDNFNIDEKSATLLLEKELTSIQEQFEIALVDKFSQKLALNATSITLDEKTNLIDNLLETLHTNKLDFTLSFRTLAEGLINNHLSGELHDFFVNWSGILKNHAIDFKKAATKMNSINPLYIPRNHVVEKMIEAAIKSDYSLFTSMNELLKHPFEENLKFPNYSLPPGPDEEIDNTFCGT